MSEQFHYTPASGDTVSLPLFTHIPAGVLRRLRGANDLDFMFGVIEACTDDATLAVIDAMTIEEVSAMAKAWRENAGVSPGESSASSTS